MGTGSVTYNGPTQNPSTPTTSPYLATTLVPDARTLATELIGTRMARDVLSAVHMVTRDLPLAPVWPGRAP